MLPDRFGRRRFTTVVAGAVQLLARGSCQSGNFFPAPLIVSEFRANRFLVQLVLRGWHVRHGHQLDFCFHLSLRTHVAGTRIGDDRFIHRLHVNTLRAAVLCLRPLVAFACFGNFTGTAGPLGVGRMVQNLALYRIAVAVFGLRAY